MFFFHSRVAAKQQTNGGEDMETGKTEYWEKYLWAWQDRVCELNGLAWNLSDADRAKLKEKQLELMELVYAAAADIKRRNHQ
jgi:hypothetical protein